AAHRIDPEGDDVVALQVGRVKHAAGGVEGEEARRVPARRLPVYWREPPGRSVDAEGHDAVVPAVRDVDEAPGRRDLDFGRGVPAHERLGQRWYHLERLEFATL